MDNETPPHSSNQRPVRYLVRFTGHVQGVGFRATAVAQSRGLAVHGFVRNETDGSVELDVDGPEGDVKVLIQRIQDVMRNFLDRTSITELPPQGHQGGIKVRY